MKKFVLILTAMVLALTLCACTLVEPNPEDPVEDAMGGAIEDVIGDVEDIEVEDSLVTEEVEEVEDVFEEEEDIYGGICPFTENIVDPDNVSENAIYIETAEIPEGATEYVLDHLANMTSELIVDLMFSEEVANGMSVTTGIRAYNGTTNDGEYFDHYYFPIMYGDEAVALAISSYNDETEKYNFQFGGNTICDVMNCIETTPENPAVLVYFEDSSGGYFVTTTSAWRFVADENGSYKIAEENIPDSLKAIMNREVNPDNVVAIYGATVATEELIDD